MIRKAKIENGMVRGVAAADPRITAFKGIPFAAPPVGENRWRAPQPVVNWKGERLCCDFAPISMQAIPGLDRENIYSREWAVDPDIPMDENCLYLNVWTPANNTDDKLPVYVWYFGGGLQVGNTAEMEFDGERIARRGIVVVTVNYRLNVFGFLSHPEITAEAPEAPANFGYLDQQAGTRWVKRNIAAFGGDPERITIGGQSAGGGSVLAQLTSPQNDGLFQAAIVQSGIFTEVYPGNRLPFGKKSLEETEKEGEAFFDYLGVNSLAQARAINAVTLRDKMLSYDKFWGPAIDDRFCVGDSFALFCANKRYMVPVMMGCTQDEFHHKPSGDLEAYAKERFGGDAEEFLRLCEQNGGAAVPMIEYAIRVAASSCETPFYYYNFDADIPGWDDPGSFHSVDLWFFFETLAKCWRPFTGHHYDLARVMCDYWANFIKRGDPNDPDGQLPNWKPYTPEAPYGMGFKAVASFDKNGPSPLMKFLVSHRQKENV